MGSLVSIVQVVSEKKRFETFSRFLFRYEIQNGGYGRT
jgi:hypothetical protein